MFFVIEGANGAGKTTLIKGLNEKGYKTLSSPNGTELAKALRPMCRGTSPWEDIDKKIQFMLFSAARYDEYIRCVHNKDEIIIADRWWTSTYVYQVILGGISLDFLKHTIHPNEKIDKVIILDGKSDVLIERVAKERMLNPKHGVCSWTKEKETQYKLMQIYREDLTRYLGKIGIEFVIIDTTDKSPEDVCNLTESIIKE